MSAEEPTTCDFAGHEWEDMGGGMEVCSECFAEREAPDGGVEQVPEDTIRRYREGA